MKAWRLNFPFEWPVRPHQREHMVHSRAMHPATLTVLLPKIEEDAIPDCWCGQKARLLVLRHQIDDCEADDLSEDGCEILLTCVTCVRGIADQVAADIGALAHHEQPLKCLTCGLEIRSFHDVCTLERL